MGPYDTFTELVSMLTEWAYDPAAVAVAREIKHSLAAAACHMKICIFYLVGCTFDLNHTFFLLSSMTQPLIYNPLRSSNYSLTI
jgi:hypothetical protein